MVFQEKTACINSTTVLENYPKQSEGIIGQHLKNKKLGITTIRQGF